MQLFAWLRRPAEHQSCSKRLEELGDRLGKVELKLAEINLDLLDKAEKLAQRLQDRERKRATVEDRPERAPRPWELHKRGDDGV